MKADKRTDLVLVTLCGIFVAMIIAFSLDLFGKPVEVRQVPLVDEHFLDTSTWRKSYADRMASGGDVDMFDCYLCHDEDEKVELTYDENNQLVIPEEHEDIVLGHGPHGRNNNCFNCHNQNNLLRFEARDGRDLKFEQSSQLCGSCHGPTKDDWDTGAHGRISGYWDAKLGEQRREDCVNCHNPHSPRFPGRKPAPPPIHLSEVIIRDGEKSDQK